MHKLWSMLFGIAAILSIALFVVAAYVPGWWLPVNASSFGAKVDGLFYLILWITTFFFVLTESILVYNLWVAGDRAPGKAPYVHGNHRLEMIWTIIPAVILVLISFVQIGTWEEIKYGKYMPKVNADVCQMVVVARQWEWRVRYPDPGEYRRWEKAEGKEGPEQWRRLVSYPYEDYGHYDDIHIVNEIHVWRGDPNQKDEGKVLVHLKTRDVLHSFFLPQMRLKQDAVPGKVIPVWFKAIDYNAALDPKTGRWVDGFDPKTGQWGPPGSAAHVWELACAEFCGSRHSMMRGKLFVHKDKADFLAWLEDAKKQQNQRTVAKPAVADAR